MIYIYINKYPGTKSTENIKLYICSSKTINKISEISNWFSFADLTAYHSHACVYAFYTLYCPRWSKCTDHSMADLFCCLSAAGHIRKTRDLILQKQFEVTTLSQEPNMFYLMTVCFHCTTVRQVCFTAKMTNIHKHHPQRTYGKLLTQCFGASKLFFSILYGHGALHGKISQ